MKLREYQQKIAGLINGTYPVSKDDASHLQSIAGSVNLAVTQEVIIRWRRLSIESYCQLTSRALQQLGIFEKETDEFLFKRDVSPYAEELGHKFLTRLQSHELDLISSLAKFERALIEVQSGTRERATVNWNYDPYAVLGAVLEGNHLSALQPGVEYVTRIDKTLPRLFEASLAESNQAD